MSFFVFDPPPPPPLQSAKKNITTCTIIHSFNPPQSFISVIFHIPTMILFFIVLFVILVVFFFLSLTPFECPQKGEKKVKSHGYTWVYTWAHTWVFGCEQKKQKHPHKTTEWLITIQCKANTKHNTKKKICFVYCRLTVVYIPFEWLKWYTWVLFLRGWYDGWLPNMVRNTS